MTQRAPRGRGSSKRPGGMHSEPRPQTGRTDAHEGDLRWSTRARCHAVLAELEGSPIDWESIQTILEGAVDEIRAST